MSDPNNEAQSVEEDDKKIDSDSGKKSDDDELDELLDGNMSYCKNC